MESFIEQAIAAGEAYGGTFEIVLVDDGSPDRSRDVALDWASRDQRIVVIELSRNFGHHAAALCAIEHAQGEYVFLIDSDLEVSPRVLLDFYSELKATGADVVYGVQSVRQGSFVSRQLGRLFWRIFNAVSDTQVPNDVMTERLMSRRYVNSLLELGDRNLFMGGMFYWPGYVQRPLSITKTPRANESTYSLGKRAILLVRAISSFSSLPLLAIFWLGIIVLSLTVTYAGFLVVRRVLYPETVLSGFTILAVLSAVSFGVNFMALGVMGLYIHRIFRQVQQRPRYIVRQLTGQR